MGQVALEEVASIISERGLSIAKRTRHLTFPPTHPHHPTPATCSNLRYSPNPLLPPISSLSHFLAFFLIWLMFHCSVFQLLVTANIVPSTLIRVTVMMEAISSSDTSVLTRATRRHIPEDGIIHSHCRKNLRSYIALTGWTL
jgi:hypothetical protein